MTVSHERAYRSKTFVKFPNVVFVSLVYKTLLKTCKCVRISLDVSYCGSMLGMLR